MGLGGGGTGECLGRKGVDGRQGKKGVNQEAPGTYPRSLSSFSPLLSSVHFAPAKCLAQIQKDPFRQWRLVPE